MTVFEQTWYDKYMNNLCTEATLRKLANAGKLSKDLVDEWVKERQEKLGF